MDFSNKTIWITGASSGIGKATAFELSKEKVHLILSGRNEEALNEVANLCQKHGSIAKVVPFDLGDEEAVVMAVQKILAEENKINALYNFGGISQRSLVSETSTEVIRKIFEVNFFGTVALTKAILPAMIASGGGQIAITSSIVGKFGFPYRSAYSASKHALHGFFESLRAENVKNNIRVSIIIPGRIKTNISLNALLKDGSAHGKMDQGLEKGKDAGKSAKVICRKLKKERKEILVGGTELIMVHIRRFFPRIYYYLSSKVKPL